MTFMTKALLAALSPPSPNAGTKCPNPTTSTTAEDINDENKDSEEAIGALLRAVEKSALTEDDYDAGLEDHTLLKVLLLKVQVLIAKVWKSPQAKAYFQECCTVGVAETKVRELLPYCKTRWETWDAVLNRLLVLKKLSCIFFFISLTDTLLLLTGCKLFYINCRQGRQHPKHGTWSSDLCKLQVFRKIMGAHRAHPFCLTGKTHSLFEDTNLLSARNQPPFSRFFLQKHAQLSEKSFQHSSSSWRNVRQSQATLTSTPSSLLSLQDSSTSASTTTKQSGRQLQLSMYVSTQSLIFYRFLY